DEFGTTARFGVEIVSAHLDVISGEPKSALGSSAGYRSDENESKSILTPFHGWTELSPPRGYSIRFRRGPAENGVRGRADQQYARARRSRSDPPAKAERAVR